MQSLQTTLDLSSLHTTTLKFSIYISNKKQRFLTTTPLPISRPQRLSVRCGVQFRPCIDIHKGKVKQIVGSTLCDSKEGGSTLIINFESDKSPAEYATIYKEDGLRGGHVIMLGADSLSNSATIEALRAYPDFSSAELPARMITSRWFASWRWYKSGQCFELHTRRSQPCHYHIRKERLVLDLSCRKKDGKYTIVTDRWQKFTDVYLDEKVLNFLSIYADEFLVHGVDVEGKKLGIDEELVALLGRHSPVPVTYAGGVTVMADLERIKVAGMGRVDATVGSALDMFGGNLAYKDVVAWHCQQEALAV